MEKCDQDTPEGWDLEYSGEPYQDRIKNDREYWKKFLDECIDHSKPLRILEFGCGIGDYANYLREKGHKVLGTDYSPKAIEIAKSRYPNTDYSIVDIRDFRGYNCYDIIIAFEVIEHLREPEKILYQIRKSLTPKGQFIFSLPHKEGKFGVMNQHLTLWDHNIIVKTFGRYFNQIKFNIVNHMSDGLNIFGSANRGDLIDKRKI